MASALKKSAQSQADMATATYQMVEQQKIANEQQKESNKLLSERNITLERNIKMKSKQFWIGVGISALLSIVAIAISIITLITTT